MSNGGGQLDIVLKANAEQLLATINKVTGKLDDLKGKINSLPEGDKQLNKLSKEFARTALNQQKLVDTYNKLGTSIEDVAPKLEKTGNASKSARTALTSLSLALQDLPFGFIGIQNNLPGVIQGFGNLSSSSTNLNSVTSQLIQQLKGPAGVFLAFSAITTVVTFLVQKYGSLGGAIDALLGKQNSLTSQIAKFNDEYDKSLLKQQLISQVTNDATASQAGQIAVIKELTKKATDLTLTEKEQNNALEQLKKITGEYHDGLKIGVGNVDLIRQATEKYIKVIIAKARIQKYSNEIDLLQEQKLESERLQKEQESLIKSDIKRNNQSKNYVGTLNDVSAQIVKQSVNQIENQKVVESLARKTFDLNNKIQDYEDRIALETDLLVKNTVVKTDNANATKAFFESYKPSQEYLDFFKSFTDTNKYKKGEELFNEISNLNLKEGTKSVQKFNEKLQILSENFPGYFDNISVSSDKELPKAVASVRTILDTALKALEQGFMEVEKSATVNQISGKLIDLYLFNEQVLKERLKAAKEIIKKTFSEYQPIDTTNVIGFGPATYEKAMAQLIAAQKKMKEAQNQMLKDIQATSSLIGEVFFNPLEEQFKNLITTGKINLKEFSKIVEQNLKALVAKIIATGIITLLATIATGGFSAETLATTKMTGFQIFGKAFASALGFGGTSAANFGGVNPGGLAMSGAVSLSLRGADLVGAINRTNTNINRIG